MTKLENTARIQAAAEVLCAADAFYDRHFGIALSLSSQMLDAADKLPLPHRPAPAMRRELSGAPFYAFAVLLTLIVAAVAGSIIAYFGPYTP